MRNALITALLMCLASLGHGQVIYISSSTNAIYRLNLDDCTYTFVTQINRQLYDISFHPDGSFYGISGNGNFFGIDTLTGNTNLLFDFGGQTFNSLTIGADGLVYTIGDQGELWTYNLATGVATYLGDIGFSATGDLAFYKGVLYAAVTGDRIVRIDLNKLSNSAVVVNDNVTGNILGIVSDVVDCTEINCYAITNGQSAIYNINFTTNRLELVCQLNITVGGGASTTEFLGSSPLEIDTAVLVQPNCKDQNGEAVILAAGGFGALSYTLDGNIPQDTNRFTALNANDYTVYVMDQRGCIDSISFSLTSAESPVIDTVILQPSTCGQNNGSISTVASGGTGPLTYSLDSLGFQSTGIFGSLGPARYRIYVIDSAGCIVQDDAVIDSLAAASIIRADISNTTCGDANGAITVYSDQSTGMLYSIDGLNFQSDPTFENLFAISYPVILQDTNGCRDTLLAVIGPSGQPTIDTVITQPENCGNQNGSLSVTGSGGIGNYQFSLDGTSYQLSPDFVGLTAGSYDVFVIDDDGCIGSATAMIGSTAGLSIFNIEIVPTACNEASGQIRMEIEGGTAPVMISVNGQAPTEDKLFTSLPAGNYQIFAIDASGCSTDTIATLQQSGCPIYIPNIFSPNGDGINDLFQIQTSDINQVTVTRFFIFDRWGNEVYKRYDLPIHSSDGWWDGTFKHFTMNPGVYAYYLEVEFDTGQRETYKGNVTLIR